MTGFEQRRWAAIAAVGAAASRGAGNGAGENIGDGDGESTIGPFLTRDAPTVRYLTGFTGSNGLLLFNEHSCVLVTDGRYRDQARRQAPDVDIVIEADVVGAAIAYLSQSLAGVIPAVTVDSAVSAGDVARLRATGIDVHTADAAIHRIRQTKDAGEIVHLEQACAITAEALQRVAREIRVGMTEIAIARRVETLFGELGAEDRAFPTIVATGEHSAIPHHRPTATPVGPGDLLVIDCGAMVDGYHADMTRTFVVAAEPQEWQTSIHAAVLSAQSAGRNATQPGAIGRDVDAAARRVIEEAGYAHAFTHGTGHGVGLQIHEAPMASASSADSISAGSVMTVEPGIYLPGRGGVRIEDTVVVGTPVRVLTEAPRDLVTVG